MKTRRTRPEPRRPSAISEGLWEGALAFGAHEDRELALRILDGYARHASEAAGLLLIRNYFNFGSRDFATNSFLVDYAPDYLARVARDTGRQDLAELAAAQLRGRPRRAVTGGTDLRRLPAGDGHALR